MKKRILLCALLALSGVVHGTEPVYTGPDCSQGDGKDEIISVVHTALISGLGDIPKSDKARIEKQDKYINSFDVGNKSLSFLVKRLASEEMKQKDVLEKLVMFSYDKKHPEDIKPGGMLYERYMNKKVYNQFYEIKSSNGIIAISERYAIPSAIGGDNLSYECSDIGRVFIVTDVF